MYISKKEFTEWSKTAREKRSLCENGEMTLEEFQAWLDESKRKNACHGIFTFPTARRSFSYLLIIFLFTLNMPKTRHPTA